MYAEQAPVPAGKTPDINICFLNPAFLPEDFRHGTAEKVQVKGYPSHIPDIPRSSRVATIDDKVDVIYANLSGLDNQYLVALSRGVEYLVRYLDRMEKRGLLDRVIGFTLYSTVGPKGYETGLTDLSGKSYERHKPEHVRGIIQRRDGLERLKRVTAQQCMLTDIPDVQTRIQIKNNLVCERPLTEDEVASVPMLRKGLVPIKWYIGGKDAVGNPELSERIAEERFGVSPIYKADWGHVAPLTHTQEVAEITVADARHAFIQDKPIVDHKDSFPNMMYRRELSFRLAREPIDFYEEGLAAGMKVNGRLTDADLVVDIGGSSGEMAANAALNLEVHPRILVVEPDREAEDAYNRLPGYLRNRVTFQRGYGETLDLPDNSAAGMMLHNTIFRLSDPLATLRRAQRYVRPGGFIVISSNAEGHAPYRHGFEDYAFQSVKPPEDEPTFTIPSPPADGHYLRDIRELIDSIDGLTIRDDLFVEQKTETVITRGEALDHYLTTIMYSAANTDMPEHLRSSFRNYVRTTIGGYVEKKIAEMEQADAVQGIEREPFFADPIHRGMIVIVNDK